MKRGQDKTARFLDLDHLRYRSSQDSLLYWEKITFFFSDFKVRSPIGFLCLIMTHDITRETNNFMLMKIPMRFPGTDRRGQLMIKTSQVGLGV